MARYKVKATGIEEVIGEESSKKVTIFMQGGIPIIEFSDGLWTGADLRTILVRLPKAYRHLKSEYRKENKIKL